MKTYEVTVNGEVYIVKLKEISEEEVKDQPVLTSPKPSPTASEGTKILAPMAGKILRIDKQIGDSVKKGENLCIIEAMKMETAIQATTDGKVSAIAVEAGQMVDTDELLMLI